MYTIEVKPLTMNLVRVAGEVTVYSRSAALRMLLLQPRERLFARLRRLWGVRAIESESGEPVDELTAAVELVLADLERDPFLYARPCWDHDAQCLAGKRGDIFAIAKGEFFQ